MPWLLRGLVLLAAVMPLFAATAFHPAWWRVFIAAAIGSALGHLVARLTRGRRIAQWVVAGVAIVMIAVTASWLLRRGAPHDASLRHDFLSIRGKSLTWEDLDTIAGLPSVELAVPYLHSAQQVASEDQNWNTQIVGTTADYFRFMEWHLAAGEPFDATPFKAVVLGDTVVKQMFRPGQSPIGATVRIRNVPFEVVGVLAHRGTTAQGQDLDDVVLMSTEIYRQKIRGGLPKYVDGVLLVSPKSRAELDRTEADVRTLLTDRHMSSPGTDDDFEIRRL